MNPPDAPAPPATTSPTTPEDGIAAMVLEALLVGLVANRMADLGPCRETDKVSCGCSECLGRYALERLGPAISEIRANEHAATLAALARQADGDAEKDGKILDGLRHAYQVRGSLVRMEMIELIELADRGLARVAAQAARHREAEEETESFGLTPLQQQKEIERLSAALAAARRDALEEAAKIVEAESVEDGEPEQLRNLVAAIRSLSRPGAPTGTTEEGA